MTGAEVAAAPAEPKIGPGQVEFVDKGDGHFAVRGDLTFRTAGIALAESKELFADHSILEIDLSEVKRTDSAGLALLLEWVNWAKNYVREIRFRNVPDEIFSIAQISEVDDLLSKGERWTGVI
ncbi:MAG: STAS domain-containing protein [Gammaproteobacteria bacterium]